MVNIRYIVFTLVILLTACSLSPAPSTKEGKTGIMGVVLNDQNQPVSNAYLYIYRSLSSRLMGPADFMEKSDEQGNFFFDIPEGEYYLVVRKRMHGGDAGPLKQGDRVAIYKQNPIKVYPDKISFVNIILPENKSVYFKRMPIGDRPITLKVLTKTDRKLKALIYEGDVSKKAPDYVVDIEGNIANFSLNSKKTYFIVIREGLREKVGEDEPYAIFGPFSPEDGKGEIYIELKK